MTLLLQMAAGPRPPTDALRRAPPDVGAAAASLLPTRGAPARRDLLKKALRDWTYERMFDARLSRIPVRLPFTRKEILSRLQETDEQPQNRDRLEERLELETDLKLLERELQRPPRELKRQERKKGRLLHVWDYLNAQMERTRMTLGERERRLWYNVGVFFRSDLPPAYLTDFGTSTHWETAALAMAHNAEGQRLVHGLTGHPAEAVTRDVFLAADVPLQKIDKAFRTYGARNLALAAKADEVLDAREALEFYVDLFSAPDLRSIRRPHPVSMSRLDPRVLEELLEALMAATVDLRRTLVAEYPGGLSGFQWTPRDDPHLVGLIRLELEPTLAG